MKEYNTVKGECTAEITEKKSRFIATVRPVSSEDEALAFVAEMKKKYWDARHNCSAYIVLGDMEQENFMSENFKIPVIEKCSDDGEPSKTAGSPMLETIRGAGLKNVAIVVTRYFGGILLGTGGLVKAYSQAALSGIEAASVVKMKLMNRIEAIVDYNSYGRLTYIAGEEKAVITNTEFTDVVKCICLCDDTALGKIKSSMAEYTAGKCSISLTGKGFYEV